MKHTAMIFALTFGLTTLSGQVYPTNHIIHPTADILPALSINLQGGYSDLVGRSGWSPALRLGLGGAAEFEWAGQYYYSDLSANDNSIPTAGVKFALPQIIREVGLTIAFYNAQKWKNTQSQQFALQASPDYSSANIQDVGFESIYSRVDLLMRLSWGDRLILYPSVYYLESKTRDLNVSYFDEAINDYVTISNSGIVKQTIPGAAMGMTYRRDKHFAYIAQYLAAPQYQLDTGAKVLKLSYRHLFAAGTRYNLGSNLVVDTGIYHDSVDLNLSDLQVYFKVNLIVNPNIFGRVSAPQ